MSTHSHIQSLLYDYLRDELTPAERQEVEAHLEACSQCSRERDEIRAFSELMVKYSGDASVSRGEAYWQAFADNIQKRIQVGEHRGRTKNPFSAWEKILSFSRFQRRPAFAFGAALAMMVVAAIILFRPHDQVRELEQAAETVQPPVETASRMDPRMGEYFRKSKVLLVGLTNMKMSEDQAVDFSAERKASRDLIHQAVYLKSQPLDVRSARLINDLEKILIELSNLKEENNLPNIEIIRGGIHQENLLFKIRMAESLYDSSSYGKHSF